MSMGKTILIAASLSFLGAVLVSRAASVTHGAPAGPLQAHAATVAGP
ncbi:hypothetical protein [Novosphingobium sp. BL-52-GroH]